MGVQAQVDALHGSTGWLLLQLELKNAFNSIARPAILKALEGQCPSMMPWVRQAFQPAPLLVGREVTGRPEECNSPPRPLCVCSGRPSRPGHPDPAGYHANLVSR